MYKITEYINVDRSYKYQVVNKVHAHAFKIHVLGCLIGILWQVVADISLQI